MQYTLALALAAASFASAQGVSGVLTPPTSAPPGCTSDYASSFEITVVLPASKKRDVAFEKRAACGGDGVLVASLKGGVLTDAKGRIGAIVANHQFQFDGPPAQTGSIYTGGWSVCGNGSLAIGGSAVFYQCLSGTFYNLYDQSTGAQCSPVEIDVIPCGGGGGGGATQGTDGQVQASQATQATDGQVQASSAGPHVSQITDGQVQASSAGPKVTQIPDGQIQASSAGPKVTQIPDGQIQASSAGPKVTQISDGQVQAPTGAPVSQYTDGQLQVPTGSPVSQISDGQVQAPTGAPVSQISDGQVQAPTGAPVSQISDGQVQAPTGKPVSQISDGQVQAPTGAPVSQISDGQIQATLVTSATPVSQASDGQVQATGAPTVSKVPFTGAAAPQMTLGPQLIVGAMAVAGFAMM